MIWQHELLLILSFLTWFPLCTEIDEVGTRQRGFSSSPQALTFPFEPYLLQHLDSDTLKVEPEFYQFIQKIYSRPLQTPIGLLSICYASACSADEVFAHVPIEHGFQGASGGMRLRFQDTPCSTIPSFATFLWDKDLSPSTYVCGCVLQQDAALSQECRSDQSLFPLFYGRHQLLEERFVAVIFVHHKINAQIVRGHSSSVRFYPDLIRVSQLFPPFVSPQSAYSCRCAASKSTFFGGQKCPIEVFLMMQTPIPLGLWELGQCHFYPRSTSLSAPSLAASSPSLQDTAISQTSSERSEESLQIPSLFPESSVLLKQIGLSTPAPMADHDIEVLYLLVLPPLGKALHRGLWADGSDLLSKKDSLGSSHLNRALVDLENIKATNPLSWLSSGSPWLSPSPLTESLPPGLVFSQAFKPRGVQLWANEAEAVCRDLQKPPLSPHRWLQGSQTGPIPPPVEYETPEVDTESEYVSELVQCNVDKDCPGDFDHCQEYVCRGFEPSFDDSRVITCAEGYRCSTKAGEIPGKKVSSDFNVIAIRPTSQCGLSPPLTAEESIFYNSNHWLCDKLFVSSCIFTAGVALRTNKTLDVEYVRLCGCANVDADGSGKPCDAIREYNIPLGLFGVQECTRNAHCINHQIAYCVQGKCSGVSGFVAGTGLRVAQCILARDCTIQHFAEKTITESIKVLPITANNECGAKVALDPDYVKDSALPCVLDINNDGICDINLGLPRTVGTSRLCGCVGDPGGNGKDCDQIEDFDMQIGLVEVGECVVDVDCVKTTDLCIQNTCVGDTFPPSVVSSFPVNNSFAVPPINQVTLTWNENIQFTTTRRKVIIACLSCDDNVRWDIEIQNLQSQRATASSISIKGRELTIIPDVSVASFPEGKYVVGYEGGIVADTSGNLNFGAINIVFIVSKDAGCPFLYLTGFSTVEQNLNGPYVAIDPLNGHAAWKGGLSTQQYIYWRDDGPSASPPGNWIVSSVLDGTRFTAYADLNMMLDLKALGGIRPPSGSWMKWQSKKWTQMPDVQVHCTNEVDQSFPRLIQISPGVGDGGVPYTNLTIELKFSKPMTYGHWANLTLVGRSSGQTIQFAPDFEYKMRGDTIVANGTTSVFLVNRDDKLGKVHSGEVYDLVADLGCLTDLAYNPWGPVKSNQLYFTTFGMSCSSFPDVGSRYTFLSPNSSTVHEGFVTLACTSTYDTMMEVPSTDPNEPNRVQLSDRLTTRIQCLDGKWSDVPIQCRSRCPNQPDLDTQYVVLDGNQTSYLHGTQLRVACAPNAIALQQNLTEDLIECVDGEWSQISLQCSATCPLSGPFGSAYVIENPDTSSSSSTVQSVTSGTQRRLRCAESAVLYRGVEPDIITCDKGEWTGKTLECYKPCPLLPQYSGEYAVVPLDTAASNATSKIACAQDHTGFNALGEPLESTLVFCSEGQWKQADELFCYKSCYAADKGFGYRSVPTQNEEASELVDPAPHLSSAQFTCAVDATVLQPSETGQLYETVRCLNGHWESGTLRCLGSCQRPSLALGRGYLSTIETAASATTGKYAHGSRGAIYCAADSIILAGVSPESVICYDGRWLSMQDYTDMELDRLNEMAVVETALKKASNHNLHLVCSNQCGPYTPDLLRFQDSPFGEVRLHQPDLSVRESSSGSLSCAPGYSSTQLSRHSPHGSYTCKSGYWEEVMDPLSGDMAFDCAQICTSGTLSKLFSLNFDLVDSSIDSLLHNEVARVKCRQGTAPLIGDVHLVKASVRCYNGQLIYPALVCTEPSCFDGRQNGDEEGIDCGGSKCRYCHPCEVGLASCSPDCNDHVRNGHEDDIDCNVASTGIIQPCPECQYCQDIPSNIQTPSYRYTFDFGATFSQGPHQQRHLAGSRFHVMCAEGYEQTSSLPYLRYQSYECSGATNSWILSDHTSSFYLRCELPTCDDQRLNGDELGVDCGGSCDKQCPSCQDGIQNQDESGVDCGGLHCFSCRPCNTVLFKNLDFQTVQVTLSKSMPADWVQAITDFVQIGSSVDHDHILRIECRNETGPSSWTQLRCDNGLWETMEGASSVTSLSCHGTAYLFGTLGSSEYTKTLNAQLTVFQELELPVFEALRCDSSPRFADLCALIPQFTRLVEGECGALLAGYNVAQVQGFCRGPCYSNLRSLLQTYSNLKLKNDDLRFVPKSRIPDAQLKGHFYRVLETLAATFCATGPTPFGSSALDPSDSYYCFASAGQILTLMNNLNVILKSQLDDICPVQSCFRSNLNYFESLIEFFHLGEALVWDTAIVSRRLEAADITHRSPVFKSAKLVSDYMYNLGQSLFASAGLSEQTQPFISVGGRRRRLQTESYDILTNLMLTPDSIEWFHLYRLSLNLLNLLCLKDVNGQSCAPIVARFSTVSKPRSSSVFISEDLRCLSLITRHYGQILYTQGVEQLRPSSASLGILLRAYGAIAGRRSSTDLDCANVLGKEVNSFQVLQTASKLSTIAQLEEKARLYPSCKCPLTYIGDLQCDQACFNPECGFDEGDCLFENLFPGIYQHLTSIIPLHDVCHPLNKRFDCSAVSSSGVLTDSAYCNDMITGALTQDGCCASARWNILREVLSVDNTMYHRSWKASSPSDDRVEYDNYPSLSLQRSIKWLEVSCQMTLDSTCSRGLRRSAIKITLTIQGLSSEVLSPRFEPFPSQLIGTLRTSVSDLLAIPFVDITEMRFWPGSVDVEMIIDSGYIIASVMQEAIQLQEQATLKGSLSSAVRKLVQGYTGSSTLLVAAQAALDDIEVNDIQIQWTTLQDADILKKRSLSMPVTGTLDMDTFTQHLTYPGCLNELSSDYFGAFASSIEFRSTSPSTSAEKKTLLHGSTREIQCAKGYAPTLRDSGPSPQFVQCDRGRWIPENTNEPKLKCRRPCVAYELWETDLASNGIMVVAQNPEAQMTSPDGAYRTLQCAAGFTSTSRQIASETVYCDSGAWTRRSLECGQTDFVSAQLKTATCGENQLIDFLTQDADLYALKVVATGTYSVSKMMQHSAFLPNLQQDFQQNTTSQLDAFLESTISKQPLAIKVWSLKCVRGYTASVDSVWTSAPIFCVNNRLLTTTQFRVPDWENAKDEEELFAEALRHYVNYEFLTLAPDQVSANEASQSSYKVTLLSSSSSSESDFSSKNQTSTSNRLQGFQCVPEIIKPPTIPSKQPGMSDATFFGLVFGGSCSLIATLVVALFCVRTQCVGKKLPEHPGSDNPPSHMGFHQSKSGHDLATESADQLSDIGELMTIRAAKQTTPGGRIQHSRSHKLSFHQYAFDSGDWSSECSTFRPHLDLPREGPVRSEPSQRKGSYPGRGTPAGVSPVTPYQLDQLDFIEGPSGSVHPSLVKYPDKMSVDSGSLIKERSSLSILRTQRDNSAVTPGSRPNHRHRMSLSLSDRRLCQSGSPNELGFGTLDPRSSAEVVGPQPECETRLPDEAVSLRRPSFDGKSVFSETALSSYYSEVEVDSNRLRELCKAHPEFDLLHQLKRPSDSP